MSSDIKGSDIKGSDYIIATDALRRVFGAKAAVDGLTFSVPRGAAVGYIGANGAGKSTTIKMLTGILVPTVGPGADLRPRPAAAPARTLARRIGVVFGQRSQLWWDLPLRDSFRLLARDPPVGAGRAARRDRPSSSTAGPRRRSWTRRCASCRWASACAARSRPRCCTRRELLFLDEPTIGLDVLSKERLRVFLLEQRAARHHPAAHDPRHGRRRRLCDRILVVDHGQLAFDGTLGRLVEQVGAERILVLDLTDPAPPLDGIPGTRLVGWRPAGCGSGCRSAPGETTVAAILAAVAQRAVQVHDLAIDEPDIEAVVRRLYAG